MQDPVTQMIDRWISLIGTHISNIDADMIDRTHMMPAIDAEGIIRAWHPVSWWGDESADDAPSRWVAWHDGAPVEASLSDAVAGMWDTDWREATGGIDDSLPSRRWCRTAEAITDDGEGLGRAVLGDGTDTWCTIGYRMIYRQALHAAQRGRRTVCVIGHADADEPDWGEYDLGSDRDAAITLRNEIAREHAERSAWLDKLTNDLNLGV